MNNVTITHTVNVSLALTADQWSLYHIQGRNAAAHGLNRDVAQAINEALGLPEETPVPAATEPDSELEALASGPGRPRSRPAPPTRPTSSTCQCAR